jgi:hypothetical protein
LIALGVSIATMLGIMLGVVGFTEMEVAGVDEQTLREASSGLGIVGIAIIGIVQLIVSVLVIWWLTRPTQAGANQRLILAALSAAICGPAQSANWIMLQGTEVPSAPAYRPFGFLGVDYQQTQGTELPTGP